ncbi:MAG: outer membrane protein TolC [Vicingaceae bacterium]|jgi:outer membrane protein TolC
MKYSILVTVFLLTLFGNVKAQNKLSFEQALALTLANNYDILMAQVSEEIAENSASKANNGFLPTVTATGAYNWTRLGGEFQTRAETRTLDPNNSYNYNAGATVNYTLFDGQGRKFRYLQAKGSHQLSELQLQLTIQNTILELSRIYYEVARLEESTVALQNALSISKERKKRAEYAYEYGQVKQLDVLNAKVDLNADSIALMTGNQQLENLKRNLNFVMGQTIDQEIQLDSITPVFELFVESEVLLAAEQKNLQLQLVKTNQSLSEYSIGASQASWLPTIGANAGYGYRGQDDPNGAFVLGSQNFGPQAGLSLSWNLFNGSANTQVKNAKLSLKSSQIEQQSLEQNIKSQGMNSYATYRNLLFVMKASRDNVATAEDNFNRSEESYKLGQINSVEFRQAQLNLLNAEQALSTAKYDAKNAELQVLAVMGALVE